MTDQVARADLDAEVAYWAEEIQTYDRTFEKFTKRGRKIYKKYKDVRSPREDVMTRYNILWANVQTRLPALYARNPKVQVERRFKDSDPVGRVSGEILERSIQYTLDHENDAWQVNRQAVLDFELPGRSTVWIRYVPHFKKQTLAAADDLKEPPTDGVNPEIADEGVETTDVEPDPVEDEILDHEETKLDYVYWEDYGHSWARMDEEVRGKWRRVYMDRDELRERFEKSKSNPEGLSPTEIDAIPLEWSPKNLNDTKIKVGQGGKKAIVYEIWDKRKRKVLWIVKNYPKKLDERKDPLGLKDFFPTPRGLYANLCNDDLVPTPNFAFYQDQANEVDELSTRIVSITKALKVAGVRDTSAEGLDRLLSEGVENQLVPVEGWAVLKEKGGLAGVFELLPMDMIADTLGKLREQRTAVIEDIYQLTGISDIVRGMSDPTETATAQQLKGQFSMVRIEDAQTEVQRFCRDEIVIIGQIVAGYSIDTLKAISGVKLLTAAEKQQIQMQMAAEQRMQQMAQSPSAGMPPSPGVAAPSAGQMPPSPQAAGQMGQMHPGAPSAPMTPQPGQAPISPDKVKLLEEPTWEEVEALLKNPVLREFRLDIETDSTIRMDEEAEKAARVELITAVGGFVQQMTQAGMQAPEILPMLGELLMFGIRAFKTARSVEQTFEDMMKALEKAAAAPKPPPPEVVKAEADAKTAIQVNQDKVQGDIKIAQGQQQAQAQQAAQENQLESQRDIQKSQLEAQTTKEVEGIKSQAQIQIQELTQAFEAQKQQWITQAQERIAAADNATKLKIAEMQNEQKQRDQEHDKTMARQKHQHEKEIVKMTPKPQAA